MEEVRAVVIDDGIECNNCHQSLNRRNQDSSHSCDNNPGRCRRWFILSVNHQAKSHIFVNQQFKSNCSLLHFLIDFFQLNLIQQDLFAINISTICLSNVINLSNCSLFISAELSWLFFLSLLHSLLHYFFTIPTVTVEVTVTEVLAVCACICVCAVLMMAAAHSKLQISYWPPDDFRFVVRTLLLGPLT